MTPQPPLSLDSEGDIVDANGWLLAVVTMDGKQIAPSMIDAFEAINLLRKLEMESQTCVALQYLGNELWQAYDTLNSHPISEGSTPLEAMQAAAKKLLTGAAK